MYSVGINLRICELRVLFHKIIDQLPRFRFSDRKFFSAELSPSTWTSEVGLNSEGAKALASQFVVRIHSEYREKDFESQPN